MAAPTCSRSGGRRWFSYFSETTDGNFEEAFRLCSCNRKPEARCEPACEGTQNPVLRVVCSFDLEILRSGSRSHNGRLPRF